MSPISVPNPAPKAPVKRVAFWTALRSRVKKRRFPFKGVEVTVWVLITLSSLKWSEALSILGKYGYGELFRVRFYAYIFGSGHLAVGAFIVIFVSLCWYLFGSPPFTLLIDLQNQNRATYKENSMLGSRTMPAEAELSDELASNGKSSVASAEESVARKNSDSIRADWNTQPLQQGKSSALRYLEEMARRSQSVASSSVRRASLHLFVGVLMGAVGMLFFFVSTASDEWAKSFAFQPTASSSPQHADATVPQTSETPKVETTNPSSLTPSTLILLNFAHSVPRITVLIFIEVLAGFFLKQYRTAMEEFRYYESLARRRESLIAAYLIRSDVKDQTAISQLASDVLDQPLGILKQGETTMVLEAEKLSSNEFLKTIEQLKDVFGKWQDKK